MKLTFQIDYNTGWGESMFVIGSLPCMEGGLKMTPDESGKPTVTIEISPAQAVFSYRYELRRDDGTKREEWGPDRSMKLDSHLVNALIHDQWKDVPSNKPFFSSAFTQGIFRHAPEHLHSTRGATLEIRVDAPMVPSGAVIAVAGSCGAMGFWNPGEAAVMNSGAFPEWRVQLPMDKIPQQFEFKFVMLDARDHSVIAWEKGENRKIQLPAALGANGTLILAGLFFESPLQPWRGSGTAIPVFSLRSELGFGVGEFLDIIPMVDWAVSTGQQFIQLLPINDTTMTHTWTDSYPYTTNSTFALHPMYLRIDEMGDLKDAALISEYKQLREELNKLEAVDYERVNRYKDRFTRALFSLQGKAEMTSESFKKFAAHNDEWLIPYAAWCVLRDRFGTPDMSGWGEFAVYNEARVDKFVKENRHEIDYVRFIQFHLDKQLRKATEYARERGVVLKGDIPIGISRCSVDAWMYPELFNFTCTAGAPPDAFARYGQNWGFPTYRWDVMERDGYRWWKMRLKKMAEYFSAYRIDHLLGFFRIWQIPADMLHGLLGVFHPALPFSAEELREKYGFKLQLPLHTTPYITDTVLARVFGNEAAEVRNHYLRSVGDGRYELNREFDTQCDIAAHFAKRERNESNRRLCEGLMGLLDDVLFIEDPYKKGFYHPRIDASDTRIYASLNQKERDTFNRLYEDFFYHRHNQFWGECAMKKLPALIDSTGMLACAEDLGMIPACVPQVMERLKILSLEIQRMPKEYGVAFGNPMHYPYLSVCSTSTHDMPGIRQWWEDDHERATLFYNTMLKHEGTAPVKATPEICREILEMNLMSPSMLCIIPLQDWLGASSELRWPNPMDEQINVPANPRHYWRYRMHITLETLNSADEFNETVHDLVRCSGR
ncbi:MAG: 4-alpha-glucanotransferase [Firmicutes bacterium]|nr:4-alpha-glucanotransferase [Bacillota bacterium]MCM1400425.1 4-alpha-glucanotransferase [Bacteroides sp.]MCM1477627.1 4-alpha-glucanotransferase [Bacteroides sp.]